MLQTTDFREFNRMAAGSQISTLRADNVHYRNIPDGNKDKHPKQYEFIHNTSHFSGIVGGIGSGKTQGGVIRDVRAAYGWIGDKQIPTPNLGMITAPTYPMLRDITVRTFREVAGDLIESFNKSEMVAVMKNGSEILFRSAENPERLRGPNLHWWHGDEAAYYDAEVWRVCIGRTRADGLQGFNWLTTTPKGRNYIYKVFILNNAENPDYYIIKVATRDNLFLNEEFIKSLESEYEGDYAKQELEGDFVSFEGLVYPEFSYSKHVTDDMPSHFSQVIAGVDWGFVNPGVIKVYGITSDDRMNCIHEEYAKQRGIDEWATVALQLRDIFRIERFECDPSEPDYIAKFNAKGCRAVAANNTVSTGIQAVKRRLAVRADGKPGIQYYPDAKHTFSEFEQYQWARRKDISLDEPQKANDHTMDAERYAVISVERPKVTVNVGRWA
jgi:PBSX family phage terminase large subunit